MTWWEYVERTCRGATKAQIAARAGIDQTSVSRWKRGTGGIRPDTVAAFARAYHRPVIEAFVAAGFLTPQEAGQAPAASTDLAQLPDSELIDEIARRLEARHLGGEDRGDTAPTRKGVRIVEELDKNGDGTVYGVVEDQAEAEPPVTPRERGPRQR